MITRLELKNFRRHQDTEIDFGAQDQLIAITGVNGAGKTTLLEALLFAFFGETRNGRRGLDTLVTRGAELEGVEVVCEFQVGGAPYRIQRRRVEGVSSALLFCDGQLLCEGPTAVDQEMRAVLGMDAAGFKLAVIAKQKELDGLTSMSKRERRGMLARLLRVDVVDRAAIAAHERMQRSQEVLSLMGPPPAIAELEAELEAARSRHGELDASLQDARTCVDETRRALNDASAIETRYSRALDDVARAQGALDDATREHDQVESDLSAHRDSAIAPPEPVRPESEILQDLRSSEAALAEARRREEVLAAHASLVDTHREVVEAITRIQDELVEIDVPTAEKAAADAREHAAALDERFDAARNQAGDLRGRLEVLREELASLASLDDEPECPTCGQDVSAEHLESHTLARTQEMGAAQSSLDQLVTDGRALKAELEQARKSAEQASSFAAAEAERQRNQQARKAELSELIRRRDSYELRLTRELPEPVNVSEAAAIQRAFADELAQAEAARTAHSTYNAWLTRRDALTTRLGELRVKLEELGSVLASAAPAQELVDAYTQVCDLRAQLADESEMVVRLSAECTTAHGQVQLCEQRLSDARGFESRRQEQAQKARVATYTKAVLKRVHQSLSQELRPNLEGALCEILTRLSEGRFSSARLDEDYEISVLDDGGYRPLSELSGGESDLVALALRLALASVVAERHGSDALGLLILDEVFGSQDASRREAILAALRELRSLYGQVLVISHVGGIEDAADKVIDLRCDTNRKLSEVSVL